MRVKITKDPAGRYSLAYVVGEVVDLPDQQAKDLIEDGYAIQTKESIGHQHEGFTFGYEKETAESKIKKEKR